MVDVVDRATRSRMMSSIRGRDTQPELEVRRMLHREGLRFRLHAPLPGKPDLVFPKYAVAVFVHGCFWHRHAKCRYATTPSSNAEFWQIKFAANVRRDRLVTDQLNDLGWRVLTVWECEITQSRIKQLAESIRSV